LVVEQADTDEKTAFGVFPTTRKHSAWRNEDFYKSSIEFGKLESSASACTWTNRLKAPAVAVG